MSYKHCTSQVFSNYISVVIDNEYFGVDNTSPVFEHLQAELEKDKKDWKAIHALVTITTAFLSSYKGENFYVEGGIFYANNGMKLSSMPIVSHIIGLYAQHKAITPWLNLLDKLLINPTAESLFSVIRDHNMPVIEDGDFLAYIIAKDPDKITDDERAHFYSEHTAANKLKKGDHLILVKINPVTVCGCFDSSSWIGSGRIIGEAKLLIPSLNDLSNHWEDEDYSGIIRPDVVRFNGSQKDFFKKWTKPRNTHTTYILVNSTGETAYKFIGGLGQKCFKRV